MSYLTKSRGNPDTAVLKSEYPNFMRVAAYPIDKVLDAIKMPKKAQEILNVYWSYLGTPEDQLSFLHYALMVWLYISLGAQVPKNRSHGISCALADTILEKGGEIWYNSEVEHIITKDGHVAGAALQTARRSRPSTSSATPPRTSSTAAWSTPRTSRRRSSSSPTRAVWPGAASPCSSG